MNLTIQAGSVAPALPLAALASARLALSRHPECFWTRRAGVPVANRSDAELVIRRLRENGGRAAWQSAREIEECL